MQKKVPLARGLKVVMSMALCAGALGVLSTTASAREARSSSSNSTISIAVSELTTLDTSQEFDYPLITVSMLGVQQLMQVNNEGQIVPELAESYKHPNALTYIYNLRPNVKFWDGNVMTSADVVASMTRWAAPASRLSGFYENVKSVTATGPLQVTVTLTKPDITWLQGGDVEGTPIIEASYLAAHTTDLGTPSAPMMGTGPYEFTNFTPNQGMTLVPNPYYWGPKPSFGTVKIDVIPSDADTVLAIRSGQIDAVMAEGATIPEYKGITGTRLYTDPSEDIEYMGMNVKTGPFSNIYVRRAVAYAIDRKAIVKGVVGGYGTPLDTMEPPGLLSSVAPTSVADKFSSSYTHYNYSVAKAKAELAKSPYPHGFTASLATIPGGPPLNQVIAAELGKIGIHLTLQTMTLAQWDTYVNGPRDKISIMDSSFGLLYPSPAYFYNYMYNSANGGVGICCDQVSFANATVNKDLALISSTLSPTVRYDAIDSIAKIAATDVPYITLYSTTDGFVLSNNYSYKGFTAYAEDQNFLSDITPNT